MAGTDPPPAVGRLPDGVHESVRPGTALLRLETTQERTGVLDGAWWPRSRDVATELPGLIRTLSEHLGPISRVGLDSAAWDGLPTRLVVDGQVVHLDASSVGDASPTAARAAMAQAVRADNLKGAEQILLDTGAEPPVPPGVTTT
ncbi:hypothetical protein EAO75_33910 [Streptomyces sp. uw30]|uniref:DUF5994 family protein n=1 Tax=Streptomyces sp. uw30 TaxID=1828179 RepID=UPI0011CD3F8B|nr:DUF5994 family protein [Streptomyces sp. uw30]TXS42178.1 hypothetical protein EAO75_33910 [Streptomyces sp. uw30]